MKIISVSFFLLTFEYKPQANNNEKELLNTQRYSFAYYVHKTGLGRSSGNLYIEFGVRESWLHYIVVGVMFFFFNFL